MSAVERINEPVGKLRSRKRNIEIEIKDLEDEIHRKNRELKDARGRVAMLDRMIKAKVQDVKVSDHAIIRYFERKLGFDVDGLRSQILTESLVKQIRQLGDGKFPTCDGMTAVVSQGTVVTLFGDVEDGA